MRINVRYAVLVTLVIASQGFAGEPGGRFSRWWLGIKDVDTVKHDLQLERLGKEYSGVQPSGSSRVTTTSPEVKVVQKEEQADPNLAIQVTGLKQFIFDLKLELIAVENLAKIDEREIIVEKQRLIELRQRLKRTEQVD